MVLIPLHVLAFLALYVSSVHVVKREILLTHGRDGRLLLREAVRELHPYMCAPDRGGIPGQVELFARRHAGLELHVYGRDGRPLSEPHRSAPEVAAFIASGEDERFTVVEGADRVILSGLARIRAEDSCQECHGAGEQLGAATMRLDLTAEVGTAEAHLRRTLGLLIAGWVVLVAGFNLGLAWWTRRSLAQIGEAGASAAAAGASAGVPRALLDPVAAEIYASLRRLVEERRRQDEAVADRLQHTDRLASLGELAAGLAHEIKNPLAGVRGVIELLRDDTQDAKKRELYSDIVAELDRVNGTIHSLLHFARPAPPDRQAIDVAELLESSLQLLRPSLAQRGIALSLEVADGVGAFPLDRGQIRQVVTNLVANAAEAIQRNGTIAVRASRFPDGGGLIVSVRDDGPGIAPEVRGKIFEPFFTTKFSGTGLGLAVVRSLVERHGGRVEVQSELGQGSTFFVILPAPDEVPAGPGPAGED